MCRIGFVKTFISDSSRRDCRMLCRHIFLNTYKYVSDSVSLLTFYITHFALHIYLAKLTYSIMLLRSLNRENPGSNPLAAVSKFVQFCSLHVALVHSLYKGVSGY